MPDPSLSARTIRWRWEIFFGIVQRKVLTPAVADSLEELEARILAFEAEYRRHPRPVRWKFTRQEFDRPTGTPALDPATRRMIPDELAARTTKAFWSPGPT